MLSLPYPTPAMKKKSRLMTARPNGFSFPYMGEMTAESVTNAPGSTDSSRRLESSSRSTATASCFVFAWPPRKA